MRAFNARTDQHLNRRGFLRASAGAAGGLLISLYVDLPRSRRKGIRRRRGLSARCVRSPRARRPNRISINRLEFGQASAPGCRDRGRRDGRRLVAGAGRARAAADVYGDPLFGIQMTGGSASIANSFQQYRELGRGAAMLVAAAADRWASRPTNARTANSVVYGPGNRSTRYADLAEDAARKPVPDKVRLKNPSDFKIIGKPVRRLDGAAKCDGSQKFGLDLDLPGMRIAVVARPPCSAGA